MCNNIIMPTCIHICCCYYISPSPTNRSLYGQFIMSLKHMKSIISIATYFVWYIYTCIIIHKKLWFWVCTLQVFDKNNKKFRSLFFNHQLSWVCDVYTRTIEYYSHRSDSIRWEPLHKHHIHTLHTSLS